MRALSCPALASSLEEQHRLFLDTRDPPLDTALWWVEYAMRHGGTKHLRPASLGLAWWQLGLLDVMLVVGLVMVLVLLVMVMCMRGTLKCIGAVRRRCCGRKYKTE